MSVVSTLKVLAVCSLVLCCGCRTASEIRVQNVSTHEYTKVRVAGVPFGDLAVGATSDYKSVVLISGYALIELEADGRAVNAQTLNFAARRFTHRIDVVDLEARHLAVEIIRD